MEVVDKETLIKILAGVAVVISAFIAGMLGFYSQWKIKKLDNSLTQKKERESQKLKYYIPLLRCLYELDDRFNRIFQNLDKDWLSSKYLDDIKAKKGFAANPKETGYFIISSIYLLSCFFGVTEAIKKGVDTTKLFNANRKPKWYLKFINQLLNKIRKPKEQYNIFEFDPDITIIFNLLQNKRLFNTYIQDKKFSSRPKDATEIHKQIQHSLGEMMLENLGNDSYRVKSFREFYELYIDDDKFRFWFILIEGYFTDLSNFDSSVKLEEKARLKDDIRPIRLLAIHYWCRKLMKKISKELEIDELNLTTPKPEEVLLIAEVDEDLKKIITTYKLENSETYLLGLKLK